MSQSDFVSRGQALVAAGQYQEAVKVCRLGLLGRPTTVDGRVVLGQALLALKRYDEVLAEMRVALELDQGSVAAQVLKGEALLKKGDAHAALEALQRARQLAPTDHHVAELLQQAERASGKPSMSTSHPAVSFVGASDSHTKHYPSHQEAEADAEDTGDSFTRPTSLAAPKSPSRPAPARASGEPDGTPPPAVLEVGDRSGTVEVDPDLDGVEVGDDDDVAPPPVAAPGMAAGAIGGPRGSVMKSAAGRGKGARVERNDGVEPTVHGKKSSKKTPTAELADGDLLDERPSVTTRKPGGTAVRKAVGMPSGPLDIDEPRGGLPPPGGRAKPPSAAPPPGFPAAPPAYPNAPTMLENAHLPPLPLAHAPTALQNAQFPPPAPLPPAPTGFPPPSVSAAGAPRGMIAAALPTMAAVPPGMSPAQVANAVRPTIAIGAQPPPPLTAAQQQTAAAVDALFGAGDPGAAPGGWGPGVDPRSVAAANEPTARPAGLDPNIQAMFAGHPPNQSGAVVGLGDPIAHPPGPNEMRTGMRQARSPMRLALWVLTGVVLIGGGVVAGLQIRKIRLAKKIDAERQHAMDLAAQDTWSGWTSARASLASIIDPAPTIGNRAALARARALIAYEFGDGLVQAKAAVDELKGEGGLDGSLAAAYVALAQSDVKAARSAAGRALGLGPDGAAALHVAGRAALLAGDLRQAVDKLQKAADKDPRPLYLVGLAHGLGAVTQWDPAIAAVDKVLAKQADHPAALIERGALLAASGRIWPGSPAGNDIRSQLDKLVIEGRKEGGRVSPAEVAFADLTLAQVDLARGDLAQAREDVRLAADVRLEDQGFAETAVETLLEQGDLEHARSYAVRALSAWPGSMRARIALAEIALAQGKPSEALDMLEKQRDLLQLPRAQAVRGEAHLALGDLEAAREDFDGILAKLPSYEPAIVGSGWLFLAQRDVDGARHVVEPRFKAMTPSPAVATVYAAILRQSGDRDEAKKLLDKVVQGAPGPAVARAQLELARLERDLGDYRAARVAFAEASRTGNPDARLESGLLLIEDRDPTGGRDTLDALLKEAGDKPRPSLVLEVARARMLVGDHVGAEQLLKQVAQNPGALAWKLERERGRLALRRGDYAGAISAFGRALDGCGDDAETFLLAADAAPTDPTGGALADKLRKLAGERLKGTPEASLVSGKLLLAGEKLDEANAAYEAAKQALEAAHASPRRQAQAHVGLAVAAYFRKDDPTAKSELELVLEMDPSLYTAHLFAAEIMRDKDPRRALDHIRKAVELDPDSVDGWVSLGQVAAKLADRKTLADAIGKVSSLAPTSDALKQLQALRK